MADFANPHRQAPLAEQVLPRTVYDLGALITVLAQGAGTLTSSTLRKNNELNTSSRGVRVDMVIANKSGVIDVTLNVRRYIKATQTYVTMLSSTSQTANGTTTLIVHPDLTV